MNRQAYCWRKSKRIRLVENKVEIYQAPDSSAEIKVQFDEDTVWLNRQQLSTLFNRDRSVISRHISNIFKEGELEKEVVCAKYAHTAKHGAIKGKEQQLETEYYNLDVIISVTGHSKCTTSGRLRMCRYPCPVKPSCHLSACSASG